MKPRRSEPARAPGRGCACRRALLPLLLALAGSVDRGRVQGHDLFTAYIQHRVQLVVGARHLDVTLDLTFFEDTSEHERELLDADRNGLIATAEREAYLKRLAPSFAQQVRLRVAGRDLPLTPLYAPELDLLGNRGVGRGHHRLKLFFFAPTPDPLPPGTLIVVEDRLWSQVRALGSLEVQGSDGYQLEACLRGDPVYPPARAGTGREFKAHVLESPSPASAPARGSSRGSAASGLLPEAPVVGRGSAEPPHPKRLPGSTQSRPTRFMATEPDSQAETALHAAYPQPIVER